MVIAERRRRDSNPRAPEGKRISSAPRYDHLIAERRRRDSNPRAPEGKRISSAPRYDHFDTSPDYMSCGCRSGIHSFIIISELRVNENPQNENFNHSPLSVQSMSVSFSPSRHFRDTHRMW